jgi:hypothetical protein
MPDDTHEPRRDEPGDDDRDEMFETHLDCTGKKRRFVLAAYGGGSFLSATEILDGDATGMRFVMKADEHGHLPYGEMRDRIRRRLAERDVAVDPDTGELRILRERLRAGISQIGDDGPVLVVDDRFVTWRELGRMLETYEGWGLELRILDATDE